MQRRLPAVRKSGNRGGGNCPLPIRGLIRTWPQITSPAPKTMSFLDGYCSQTVQGDSHFLRDLIGDNSGGFRSSEQAVYRNSAAGNTICAALYLLFGISSRPPREYSLTSAGTKKHGHITPVFEAFPACSGASGCSRDWPAPRLQTAKFAQSF